MGTPKIKTSMPQISMPLAIVVCIIIAFGGWYIAMQASCDGRQDEALAGTRVSLDEKVDNATLQRVLNVQEKNFDRVCGEIAELRRVRKAILREITR